MSAKVFHIPLILSTPSMTLHSIVQRTPTPTNSASKDHPSAKIYHSTEGMFKDHEIDLIVVTTTPDSHFALCKSALEAHKHVLVEKPFVPTVKEAEALMEVSKKTGRLICIYQNRRWDTDFLTFRHLQAQNALGRIVEFETHFDRHKPVRPVDSWKGTLKMEQGGGVLYDLGTHLIDQVVVAFGLPRRVTAVFQAQRQDGNEEPDAITVLLGYDMGANNGLLVTVKARVISLETQQLRYWVRGTEGTWMKSYLDVQEDQLKAGLKPGDKGFGVEPEEQSGLLTKMEGEKPVKKVLRNVEPETYGALYTQFAEAILKNEEGLVPVKASEARDVLRVIEAAIESAKMGRTVEL
jgi:predicted dehydrogenase